MLDRSQLGIDVLCQLRVHPAAQIRLLFGVSGKLDHSLDRIASESIAYLADRLALGVHSLLAPRPLWFFIAYLEWHAMPCKLLNAWHIDSTRFCLQCGITHACRRNQHRMIPIPRPPVMRSRPSPSNIHGPRRNPAPQPSLPSFRPTQNRPKGKWHHRDTRIIRRSKATGGRY